MYNKYLLHKEFVVIENNNHFVFDSITDGFILIQRIKCKKQWSNLHYLNDVIRLLKNKEWILLVD